MDYAKTIQLDLTYDEAPATWSYASTAAAC
jgi:hypothetical protein